LDQLKNVQPYKSATQHALIVVDAAGCIKKNLASWQGFFKMRIVYFIGVKNRPLCRFQKNLFLKYFSFSKILSFFDAVSYIPRSTREENFSCCAHDLNNTPQESVTQFSR
jgi:hypothetical protein